MSFCLRSLSENGFDVFHAVYMTILLIIYHYLLRWYLHIKFDEINKKIDKL